jgi:hypothetical protein
MESFIHCSMCTTTLPDTIETVALPVEGASMAQVSCLYHLPINEAAASLGMCATVLKKMCRKNGVERWPYRKFKSLDSMIEAYEGLLHRDVTLACEITNLQQKRTMLMADPNLPFKSLVSKNETNAFNARVLRLQGIAASPRKPEPTYVPSISKTITKRPSSKPKPSLSSFQSPFVEENVASALANLKLAPQSPSFHYAEQLTSPAQSKEAHDFQEFVASLAGKLPYERIVFRSRFPTRLPPPPDSGIRSSR